MERRLLSIAVLTFVVELMLFLLDMGWIAIPGYGAASFNSDQVKIGEVVAARQFVRRRGFDSNIWEDSNAREQLFENDSILTLNGSSAKLKLRGDVSLELHENTLVVLEPIEENSNEPFRLRFSRGDVRTRNGASGLQVKSGEWTISAKPGTDLSVRAIDSHQVEVDVTKGGVDVVHRVSGQTAHIGAEQRLTLLPEEVGELVTASQEIAWLDHRPQRLYAHKFPIQVPLTWKGPANELEISSPGHGQTRLPLPSDTDQTSLPLEIGSYHLTLRYQNQVSQALPIEVLPAPKLIYLTPLPRDRVQTGEPLLYSWLSEVPLAGFRLEFAKKPNGTDVVHQSSTSIAKTTTAIPVSGNLYWQVVGFDEDGFIIPAYHTYPIYSVPDPLAPPLLRAPSAEDSDSASHFQKLRRMPRAWAIWALFVAVAEGKTKGTPPVIFNWENVPGADYYMIEISQNEDFLNPLIVAKSSTNFYAWSKFKKGIYYYRVAGGANSGRMGLFSVPTKVDLTIWPLPRTLPAKIKTPEPAPVVMGPPAPIKTPEPIPVAKAKRPPPPPEVASPMISQPDLPPPPEVFANQYGRIWWRGLYRVEQYEGPDRVSTSLSGGSMKAIGLNLKSPVPAVPLSLTLIYAQYNWKPRSKTELPFQGQLTTTDWTATGYWREPYSHWHYGIGLASRPSYQRQSLESITTKNETAGGFALRYSYRLLNGEMAHEGLLLTGASVLDLQQYNRWQMPLTRWLLLGAELNLKFGLKSKTGQTLETGINLGFSF